MSAILKNKEVNGLKFTEKTKAFLKTLSDNQSFHELADMLSNDIEKFSRNIADLVISRKLALEGRWSEYIVTDINVTYEEDVFKTFDLLEMYGLTNNLPQLEPSDAALICTYRCVLFDFYKQESDIVNLFHITIRDLNGRKQAINEWFILHDVEV